MGLVGYLQPTFAGLNMRVDTSLLQDNEYPLLVNGRVRDGVVSPIKSPKQIGIGLFNERIQGVYGVANFLLVFSGGKAFVKNINFKDSQFYQIKDFQMSEGADTIYIATVPESFVNYDRKATSTDVSAPIALGQTRSNHSPAVIVCQDGINQPQLIFPSGTSRKAFDFSKWTTTEREYVPIGKQMLYFNGKLYIVSADGKRIYQSVTGRPLDFVIVVDGNGNKILGQDAEATAWRVNYESITAIKELSSTNEAFLVCTERASYLVSPRYDVTLCGEPLFSNQYLFSTGAKNQFSIVDILGDTVLIDFGGIKSFNSILQLSNEGRNAHFSAIISKLFSGVEQNTCAAIGYDNYVLFSVDTTYGPLVVVFDTITGRFISIDKYANTSSKPKQFAEVIADTERTLFFVTEDNKLYQAFEDSLEEVSIYIGDFTTKQALVEQVLSKVKLTFLNVEESGTVYATVVSDSLVDKTIKKDLLVGSEVSNGLNSEFFTGNSKDSVKTLVINFTDTKQCWKVGVLVRWKFQAELSFTQLICDTAMVTGSLEQTAQEFEHFDSIRPIVDELVPYTGVPGQHVIIKGSNLMSVDAVFFNDKKATFVLVDSGTISTYCPAIEGTYEVRLQTKTGFEYAPQQFICKS